MTDNERTVVIEIEVPMAQSDTDTQIKDTLQRCEQIIQAIGDAGRCIDSGMGGGVRDMGMETECPGTLFERALKVVPVGTVFGLRPKIESSDDES